MDRSRRAPKGLPLPEHVRSRLTGRAAVLAHDASAQANPRWWADHVTGDGLGTPPSASSGPLTRAALLSMGSVASRPGASDEQVLTLVWHVLEWGTGRSERGNGRRVASLTDPEHREERLALLREAICAARSGDPAAAYGGLIRRGGGVIPWLGPAYFTKLLYFASEDVTEGLRCLVLDARVAQSLVGAGWESLPHRGNSYGANWYTDTYASYCELVDRWAREESDRQQRRVWPDEIEKALFDLAGKA